MRTADTHLECIEFARLPGIPLYLKDESTHPSGSLKHRLARSLFLYGLCNGWIREGSPVVDASSGSTAISEAYFARLLGLSFTAVMPRSTSPEKIAQIAFYGGRSHLVEDPTQVYANPKDWLKSAMATTSTSSLLPSAPPTGAATTTSPRPCSHRWLLKRRRCRPGWYAGRGLAAPPPPSGASSDIGASPPAFVLSTPNARCSSISTALVRVQLRVLDRVSRGSAGRGSNLLLSLTWLIA